MRIHILGIGGTFMGGVACLAQAAGHAVSGSDAALYPPMSTQLTSLGVGVHEGYDAGYLSPPPDQVVVGNALSRGNPAVEALLDANVPYMSGPQWLAENILPGRSVVAVAGTHGKTTTASLLAWILDYAGGQPGFLIGGVPRNFGVSARLGTGTPFVVEADEYDSAFFDKRSKFVHYRPRIAILNNLEYDHADIFPDLDAIQRQFHHFVRTIPGSGHIVMPRHDPALESVLAMGCWTPVTRFGVAADGDADWWAEPLAEDGSRFRIGGPGDTAGEVQWSLLGRHNMHNALAAMVAAHRLGVPVDVACTACGHFEGVKRRLEIVADVDGIRIYDDFAHHPSAIAATLQGLRARVGAARIVAVLEPRSATMRQGVHRDRLAGALAEADRAFVFQPPGLDWDVASTLSACSQARVLDSVEGIVRRLAGELAPGDQVVIMSNGGFEGIQQRLTEALGERL